MFDAAPQTVQFSTSPSLATQRTWWWKTQRRQPTVPNIMMCRHAPSRWLTRSVEAQRRRLPTEGLYMLLDPNHILILYREFYSVTSLSFISAERNHLLATAADGYTSVRLWD